MDEFDYLYFVNTEKQLSFVRTEMAGFPAPPAGRDHFSELLYLIKNTGKDDAGRVTATRV